MSPQLRIDREEVNGAVVLRLSGTFDAQSAALVRATLEQLEAPEVVIDFTAVRKFVDSAVAVLTGGLDCNGLRLRGLARHQEVMFRYFGIAESRSQSREKAYYTPEDVLFV